MQESIRKRKKKCKTDKMKKKKRTSYWAYIKENVIETKNNLSQLMKRARVCSKVKGTNQSSSSEGEKRSKTEIL